MRRCHRDPRSGRMMRLPMISTRVFALRPSLRPPRSLTALLTSLGVALVVPGVDNATLYLAEKRGYFSRAGIDVKIVDFRSVGIELHALGAGTVNVAAGDYGDL